MHETMFGTRWDTLGHAPPAVAMERVPCVKH